MVFIGSGENVPVGRRRLPFARPVDVEWPTLALLLGVFAAWAAALFWLSALLLWLALPVLVLALVLHSSLTHEVLHGHPFPSRRASEALVVVNLGLFIPYLRFRDTHLAHHQDARLTDPYDDPESNYFDPAEWVRLPGWVRSLLRLNNTLAGRMVVGPLVAQVVFMGGDLAAIRRGDRQVLKGWLMHLPGVFLVIWLVGLSPMPLWSYLLAAYAALSILKIRTFLEHQAHERASGRTVIIEDRGILAFLFLNNNLHVVHHMHPRVPWYQLWRQYSSNRDHYLTRNGGYLYRSYAQIFQAHFLKAKDPVPHPLWRSD